MAIIDFKHFYGTKAAMMNKQFIQIGANDGCDFLKYWIKRFKWKGILVEPIPWVFETLKKTYSNYDKVIFENVAVSDVLGTKPFYVSPKEGRSSSLGFIHQSMRKHQQRKDYKTVMVECVDFNALLDKHNVNPDIVVIDAEGYDYRIIKTIDFERFKPDVLMYEHKELPLATECRRYVKNKGYKTYSYSNNTICYCTKFYKKTGKR